MTCSIGYTNYRHYCLLIRIPNVCPLRGGSIVFGFITMFHKTADCFARVVNVSFMGCKNVRLVDSIPKPLSKSRCINFALTMRKRCYGVGVRDDVYSVRYKIIRENNRRPSYVVAITFPHTCHFHGQMDMKREREKKRNKKEKSKFRHPSRHVPSGARTGPIKL